MEVIGVSGLPVYGGVGIRPAVTRQGDQIVSPFGNLPISKEEWEEIVRDGMATRISPTPTQGGLVLYGHPAFIEPQEGIRIPIESDPPLLHRDPHLFWACQPLMACVEILHRWGEFLLKDAEDHLRKNPERALASAGRARLCTISPVDKRLRFKAFLWSAVARGVLHRTMEPVFEDAALDFDPQRVLNLRERALQKCIALRLPNGSETVGSAKPDPAGHADEDAAEYPS